MEPVTCLSFYLMFTCRSWLLLCCWYLCSYRFVGKVLYLPFYWWLLSVRFLFSTSFQITACATHVGSRPVFYLLSRADISLPPVLVFSVWHGWFKSCWSTLLPLSLQFALYFRFAGSVSILLRSLFFREFAFTHDTVDVWFSTGIVLLRWFTFSLPLIVWTCFSNHPALFYFFHKVSGLTTRFLRWLPQFDWFFSRIVCCKIRSFFWFSCFSYLNGYRHFLSSSCYFRFMDWVLLMLLYLGIHHTLL